MIQSHSTETTAMRMVREYTQLKMQEYGLQTWTFKFDNAKRRLGYCNFSTRTISLSQYFVNCENVTFMEISDTVLHEIAHAIVGARHGHDGVWKAKAIEIGCDGKRCANTKWKPQPNYEIKCISCGEVYHRHRLKLDFFEKAYCGRCRNQLSRKGLMIHNATR